MLNNQISGAFHRWVEMSTEAKEMRVKIQRALGKMMKRAMAAAFDRWLEQASEGIRLRGALARAVQKMAKRAAAGQGLTLVHFSSQPEPFLIQNTP